MYPSETPTRTPSPFSDTTNGHWSSTPSQSDTLVDFRHLHIRGPIPGIDFSKPTAIVPTSAPTTAWNAPSLYQPYSGYIRDIDHTQAPPSWENGATGMGIGRMPYPTGIQRANSDFGPRFYPEPIESRGNFAWTSQSARSSSEPALEEHMKDNISLGHQMHRRETDSVSLINHAGSVAGSVSSHGTERPGDRFGESASAYQCRIGKTRRSRSNTHDITVTSVNNRRFPCPQKGCGFKSDRLEHINRHFHTHDKNYKPYLCQFCNRGFSRPDNLKKHAFSPDGSRKCSGKNSKSRTR